MKTQIPAAHCLTKLLHGKNSYGVNYAEVIFEYNNQIYLWNTTESTKHYQLFKEDGIYSIECNIDNSCGKNVTMNVISNVSIIDTIRSPEMR